MFDASWPGWGLAQSCISAAAGLIGVFAGTLMTSRNQAKERKLQRVRDQLENFYSPMLGMRAELGAKSFTRQKVMEVAQKGRLQSTLEASDAESRSKAAQAGIPALQKLNEYNNEQLRNELGQPIGTCRNTSQSICGSPRNRLVNITGCWSSLSKSGIDI